MKTLRIFLLISGLLGLNSLLKADFFAYQLWVHPETGQNIHLFSDVHYSLAGGKTTHKQQEDFVQAVRKVNGLAIIEDRLTFLRRSSSPFAKIVPRVKQIDSRKLGSVHIEDSSSPLTGLIECCEQQNVTCINCEDREFGEESIRGGKRVDINIYSQIEQNPTNHIFVASGSNHINHVCKWLVQKGFKNQKNRVHKLLKIFSQSNAELYRYLSKEFNYDLPETFEDFPTSDVDCFIALAYYPIDIKEIFHQKNINNQMTEFSIEELKAFHENKQRLVTTIKTVSTIGATLGTAALVYKKKPKPAAITAAVGAGLYWAADRIANWWYGQ